MSLEDIPTGFATYFGITDASAQVILSLILIVAILAPIAYLTKADKMVMLITIFFAEAFCVGITWLPFWFLIVTITIVAAGFATFGSRVAGD